MWLQLLHISAYRKMIMCLSDQLCLDLKIVGLIPMLTEMAQPAVAPVAHSKFPERKFSSYYFSTSGRLSVRY